MDHFIRELCEYNGYLFDEFIQKYNSNIYTGHVEMDYFIINYKIANNKDIIYKEDILKIFRVSQEKFIECVMEDIEQWNLDINNLTIKDSQHYLWFYYLSTFLDNEPVDIKIALKD